MESLTDINMICMVSPRRNMDDRLALLIAGDLLEDMLVQETDANEVEFLKMARADSFLKIKVSRYQALVNALEVKKEMAS